MQPSNTSMPYSTVGAYNSSNTTTQTVTIQQWENQREADNLNFMRSETDAAINLHQSMISEDSININQQVGKTQKESTVLIERLETLLSRARALNTIVQFAWQHNTRLVTTGFTFATGLVGLLSGNVFSAGLMLAAGSEIQKMIRDYQKSQQSSESLISDIKAGMDLVRQLTGEQKNSLGIINTHMQLVEIQLKGLEQELKNLADLAEKGSQTIKLQVKEAQDLTKQAYYAFQQVLMTLNIAQDHLLSFSQDNSDVINEMRTLLQQAEEKKEMSGENIKEFVTGFIEKTEQILKKMIEAQKKLETSQAKLNTGLKQFHEALDLDKSVAVKNSEVHRTAKHYFEELSNRARMQSQITGLEGELEVVKEKLDDAVAKTNNMGEIIDDTLKDANELQRRKDEEWGTTSIVTGAGLGVIAAAATGGLAGVAIAVLAGTAGGALTHYRQQVYAVFVARHPQPVVENPNRLGEIRVVYNPVSTGWGNYSLSLLRQAVGRTALSSKTVGEVHLNVGLESPAICRFNLKSASKQGKMVKEDMLKLSNTLRENLKSGILSPTQCLNIVRSLANVDTEHGPICLVSEDSSYFKTLKSECATALKKA